MAGRGHLLAAPVMRVPATVCESPAAHCNPPCALRAPALRAALQARRVMQQGEVLHQVASLLSLRLLDQCGGDALEGQLYRHAS